MLLIDALSQTACGHPATEPLEQQDADKLLPGIPLPHLCALIRSSYDCSVLRGGKTALDVLTCSCVPLRVGVWPYELAAALIDRQPAVLNRRDSDGMTPLLRWGMQAVRWSAPAGLTLLVERGADVEARDPHGQTVLHQLLQRRCYVMTIAVLDHIAAETVMAVRDTEGRTLEQSLASSSAEYAAPSGDKEHVKQLLQRAREQWQRQDRPQRLQLLSEEDYLIPDVAQLVLSYLDGCERGATTTSAPGGGAAAGAAAAAAALQPETAAVSAVIAMP
jgi:hypothetical protein